MSVYICMCIYIYIYIFMYIYIYMFMYIYHMWRVTNAIPLKIDFTHAHIVAAGEDAKEHPCAFVRDLRMYVYVCTYAYIHVYAGMSTHVCVYTCTRWRAPLRLRLGRAYLRAGMRIRVYKCVCRYVYTYVCVYVYTLKSTRAPSSEIYVFMCMYAHMHITMYI